MVRLHSVDIDQAFAHRQAGDRLGAGERARGGCVEGDESAGAFDNSHGGLGDRR